MDAALRELLGQIDLATQRLLDDARTLTEADLRDPSLLPGWSRADVLAHTALGADAMRNLLAAARTGQDRPADASARTREAVAALRAADLVTYLADSAMALRAVARQLPDEAWHVQLRVPGLAPFAAAEIPSRRLTEVELHHCDLGAGYGAADWPDAFAALDLAEPMRSQRQDRLGYPRTERRPQARPQAPFRPGQRLPGSWIGQGNGR